MYLNHYNLNLKPFEMSAGPEFIWFGENHTEALATLDYGIQEDKGFVLLTGEKGTGKTAMIEAFSRKHIEKVITVKISDPASDYLEFANSLSREFKINETFASKGAFLIHFRKFLRNAHLRNKKIALIVDDAQKFPNFLLEEIRLPSNLDLDYTKLIDIFLVGRSNLNNKLGEDDNKALLQRIGLRYKLVPLNEAQTRQYIVHRIRAAGSDKEIFSPEAVRQVYKLSSGCPQMINLICDQALKTGYSLGVDKIEKHIIQEYSDAPAPANPLKIVEPRKTDRAEKEIHPPHIAEDRRVHWRSAHSTAAVFALLMFGIYFFYNSPSDRLQYSMTSENAYRNYQIYEDSIERIGKGPKPAQETPGTVLSNGTNRVPQNPVKASSTDGRPRNFIIYFQDNSNTLSENDLETLDGLVSSFKNLPNSSIIIEGYTDSAGNYWNNKKLSKIRADIIKDHFIKNGIDAARIKALGMGPENPVESNENGTGRKSSHRVEIKLIPLDKIFILSKKQSASRKF